MSEHSFYIFDPVSTDENISTKTRAWIKDWDESYSKNYINNSFLQPLEQWANHSFIDTDQETNLSAEMPVAQFKSHNASMVLRTAELPLYTAIQPVHDEYRAVTVGYYVKLPERLSKRQRAWLSLIDAPKMKLTTLFTVKEFQLLKHLKVVSAIHNVEPVNLYELNQQCLSNAIKCELSDVELTLACIRPSTTKLLLKHYSWWMDSLSASDAHTNSNYAVHAKAHKELILRNERINQLNALIYTHYYTDTTAFLGDTHKISSDFIHKTKLNNIENLSFCIYGFDGWYQAAYPRNKLTIALVAMATVGYWATDCNESDAAELLTTTIESFVMAHQTNNASASRLYSVIYQPQNPFDLRNELLNHNGLMPVLAMICSYPIKTSFKLASYFDGANDESLVKTILDKDMSNKDLLEVMITKLMYIN